jgi:hypothetical protein
MKVGLRIGKATIEQEASDLTVTNHAEGVIFEGDGCRVIIRPQEWNDALLQMAVRPGFSRS